jgi:hypothetical protein
MKALLIVLLAFTSAAAEAASPKRPISRLETDTSRSSRSWKCPPRPAMRIPSRKKGAERSRTTAAANHWRHSDQGILDRCDALSLPKSGFERTDDAARQGSDARRRRNGCSGASFSSPMSACGALASFRRLERMTASHRGCSLIGISKSSILETDALAGVTVLSGVGFRSPHNGCQG